MEKRELLYKEMKSVIDDLQYNWKEKTEKEIQDLCKKMGKIARGENAWYRANALSDPNLPEELLRIGNIFSNNHIILQEIISSIKGMHTRYELIISDDIYEFLLKNARHRKVAYVVATFITDVPQFEDYEGKWEYILSIPNFPPKKDSIDIFYRVIKKILMKAPKTVKVNAIEIFQDYLDKNQDLDEYTKEEYEGIIKKLKG
mgnify:CR=1 FL=1